MGATSQRVVAGSAGIAGDGESGGRYGLRAGGHVGIRNRARARQDDGLGANPCAHRAAGAKRSRCKAGAGVVGSRAHKTEGLGRDGAGVGARAQVVVCGGACSADQRQAACAERLRTVCHVRAGNRP